MILPTKGIPVEKALLTIGADILGDLDRPDTPSGVWERYKSRHGRPDESVSFDWFMLALTLVFAMGLVSLDDYGLLRREDVPAQNRVERPALQEPRLP